MMRMKLLAYVCDDAGVMWVNHEGASDIGAIFRSRPDRCRYAIVEIAGTFRQIDLYELYLTDSHIDLEIGDHRDYPTIEAAVMGAVLTYETGVIK